MSFETRYSYDQVYPIRAWRNNNLSLFFTQGEGVIGAAHNNTFAKAPCFQLMDERGFLPLPSNSISVEIAIHINGSEVVLPCTILSRPSGTVICPIKQIATQKTGVFKGELRLISPNSIIKFYGINFQVYEGLPLGEETTPISDDVALVLVDYDGTPIRCYSKTDALALTTLPVYDLHANLTFTGWNWTLLDIQHYINTYNKRIIVGANYSELASLFSLSNVDSTIDIDIQPQNILNGKNILGTVGTLIDRKNEISNIITGDLSGDYVNIFTAGALRYYAFAANAGLTSVRFTQVTGLNGYTFVSCTNLEKADFPVLTSIGVQSFRGLANFDTLIIRSEEVCTLSSVSAFTDTPFRNGVGGTLYVPSDLVSSYQSATNWASLESLTVSAITSGI